MDAAQTHNGLNRIEAHRAANAAALLLDLPPIGGSDERCAEQVSRAISHLRIRCIPSKNPCMKSGAVTLA